MHAIVTQDADLHHFVNIELKQYKREHKRLQRSRAGARESETKADMARRHKKKDLMTNHELMNCNQQHAAYMKSYR